MKNKKAVIEVKENGTVVLVDDSFEPITDQELLDEIGGGIIHQADHNFGCQSNDGCEHNVSCF